jgi:hypothetical protein
MTDTELPSEAQRNLLATENAPPLYKFCFTGGPCGGKTTALARVFSYLRERGFEVITVPETFTILSSNGLSFDFFSTGGMDHVIQGTVLDVQCSMEDGIERILRARGKPAVILCDRGCMDGSVYVAAETFQSIVKSRDTDIVQLRDNRYSAIFHLVTAADGAPDYYTLENNVARTESAAEARAADAKTQSAWVGSPHLYVLDNSTDFEGKMTRLIDIIAKIVGLPSNLKKRSAKFLLHDEPDVSNFPPDMDYKIFQVEKVYLQQNHQSHGSNPQNYSFIRRRTHVDKDGVMLGSVYQRTNVLYGKDDEVIEQKRIISQREYAAARLTRDPSRNVVSQRRISFLYQYQSFNIHVYEQPISNLSILHAQVEASKDGESDPPVQLPPFLNVERRIMNTKQDEELYGAFHISIADT